MGIALRRKWKPHPAQAQVMGDDTRFRIVAAGRRFGKTRMCHHEALGYAWENADSYVWWVAPTYNDANELGWEPLKKSIPEAALAREPSRQVPRTLELVNGSVISFRSGEREDSLRGRGLDYLVIDEAGSVPDRAWKSELRPTLSDTLGEMVAIGTPKGRNWFYEWFQRGKQEDATNTNSWQFSTYENPAVPDSEIEDARSELPQRTFRQEYLAEFIDDEGAVFGNIRGRNVSEFDVDVAYGQANVYVTGIDLARTRNYTVAVTLTDTGKVVGFMRERGGTWGVLRSKMEGYLADYAPGTVYIDASRDNAVIEQLDQNITQQLEPVKFGGGRKTDLIENLAARLETGDIQIPGTETEGNLPNEAADEYAQLISELEAYQFDTTRSGNVTYGPPAGMNDDTVDALALAAQKPKVMNATW